MIMGVAQANTCRCLDPCVKAVERFHNQVVDFVTHHTFEWVGRLKTQDLDSLLVKMGKIFAFFLSIATLFPFVGLSVGAWGARVLKLYRSTPRAEPAALPQNEVERHGANLAPAKAIREQPDFVAEDPVNEIPVPPVLADIEPPNEVEGHGADLAIIAPLEGVVQEPDEFVQEPNDNADLNPIRQLDPEDPAALRQLIEYLKDPHWEIRDLSAQKLAHLAEKGEDSQNLVRNAGAIPVLINLLTDPIPRVAHQAAFTIAQLAYSNPDNQTEIRREGGINTIAAIMENCRKENWGTLFHVINTIGALAEDHLDNQMAIQKNGIILHLVNFLGHNFIKVEAAVALMNSVYENEEIKCLVRRAGIIPTLVGFLKEPDQDLKIAATQILIQLTSDNKGTPDEVSCNEMIDAEAIPLFGNLLDDQNKEIRINAVQALGFLALRSEFRRNEIGASGAIKKLVELLREEKESEDKYYVILALAFIVDGNSYNQNFLREEKGIEGLVIYLNSEIEDIRNAILLALLNAANNNRNNKKLIWELGAIPIFVKMLNDESPITRERAIKILGILPASDPEIQREIRDGGGIKLLTLLLDDKEGKIAVNAIRTLEKLVETNTENQEELRKYIDIERHKNMPSVLLRLDEEAAERILNILKKKRGKK